MKSKAENRMKQIACQKCKKIFEKRAHITPSPKYCTRTCYAQALRVNVEVPKAEQINAAPLECTPSMKFFVLTMVYGFIAVIIGTCVFIIITDYVWSF